MFTHDSESIKQLLIAEKRAAEKIEQARKRKNIRLKQAKEEAQLEIGAFRAEKEKEFKEYEAKYLGSQESALQKIEKDTDKLLVEMTKFVRLNKDVIIECLLDKIFNINCEVHENFRAETL
ncbi:V-type proton ATPase subunit G-like [Uloborus diversus]|uniref:V-type proton ATPase subunit G-like n=1 Tax=Uloborus diversus TaxID=327109 RepID=UPI002409D473|nr:V-type proton ATPase subunit G-like [Uloborus diversus]